MLPFKLQILLPEIWLHVISVAFRTTSVTHFWGRKSDTCNGFIYIVVIIRTCTTKLNQLNPIKTSSYEV